MSATPARRVAYEVLRRVFEHGAYADRALRSAARRHGLEGRERALAQRLAYGAVQRRASTEHVIAALAGRPAGRIDDPLLAALRLGAFELLFDDAAAAHAAVDQAVELAKGGRDGGRRHRGAGLVNAVLRRLSGEGRDILAAVGERTPEAAAITHSLPPWIAGLWWRERGPEGALSLMRAANQPPRRSFRLTAAGQAAAVVLSLRTAGAEIDEEPLPPSLAGLAPLIGVAGEGGGWQQLEGAVERGELVPQSAGSAAAAALLGVTAGECVLDLCAAPGIKTTQLAEAAGESGRVVAVERDPGRAAALGELCARVGARAVEVVVGDGSRLRLGSGYDRILVDAPCSSLGTLASRPDARWRRTPAELESTAELQSRLLEAAAAAMKPGGALLYSVCTVSRREGTERITELLRAHPELEAEDLGAERPELADDQDPRCLQLLPGGEAGDGFFIARLRRRP